MMSLQPTTRELPYCTRSEGSGLEIVGTVACHLLKSSYLSQNNQQHQPKDSWGIGVSLVTSSNGVSSLEVVYVERRVFDPHLQWAWTTSSLPETGIIWNQSYGSDWWRSYFSMLPLQHNSPQTLMPGDIIVGINGLPISSFGGSLSSLANYLRECQQLFVVAVRYSKPRASLTSAQSLSNELGNDTQRTLANAYAYSIFQQRHLAGVAPLPAPAFCINSSFQSPIVGLVTSSFPQRQLSRIVTPSKPKHSSIQLKFSPAPPVSSCTLSVATNKRQSTVPGTRDIPKSKKSQSKHVQKASCTKVKSTSRKMITYINPMFSAKMYDDNEEAIDPDEETTSNRYLVRIDASNFLSWLEDRKRKWRSKWNIQASVCNLKVTNILGSFSAFASPSSLAMPTCWTNPMFQMNSEGTREKVPKPYCDNHTFDPYDGSRKKEYLVDVNSSNFYFWLRHRKWKWRSRWNITVSPSVDIDGLMEMPSVVPSNWTNPMFMAEKDGDDRKRGGITQLPYDDNFLFDPDDGNRHDQFLVTLINSNFSSWLRSRKEKWRSTWKVYRVEPDEDDELFDQHQWRERCESTVRYDFWANRYPSFECWLASSTLHWKKSYSWNSRKRKRIQQVCEEIVQFPSSHDSKVAKGEFKKWLRVRKNQWRLLRRKRQRRMEEEANATSKGNQAVSPSGPMGNVNTGAAIPAHVTGDLMHIDALLEEQERTEMLRRDRKPVDVSFLFLPSMGCPDDVAAHCLQYLHHSEHGKLFWISKKLATGLKSRVGMWELLCPSHWHLPRRPRKPWHELYLSKLRSEENASRKQWDDLLAKVADVLLKGDQLKVVQKLIERAEDKFSFTVDYVSGVVCERNAILNLAVINQRHKIVHWLVEKKNADIETSDRGHFTPLINAAWGGDKHLVRFLLSHGADRSKIGRGHYTEALAPTDFDGLTAEGWARKKGFDEIAELIRVGL